MVHMKLSCLLPHHVQVLVKLSVQTIILVPYCSHLLLIVLHEELDPVIMPVPIHHLSVTLICIFLSLATELVNFIFHPV